MIMTSTDLPLSWDHTAGQRCALSRVVALSPRESHPAVLPGPAAQPPLALLVQHEVHVARTQPAPGGERAVERHPLDRGPAPSGAGDHGRGRVRPPTAPRGPADGARAPTGARGPRSPRRSARGPARRRIASA